MKNVKRLLTSVIALVMIFTMVFTMSACDQTMDGSQNGGTPDNEWGADVQITPGQNGYGGEGKIQITFKLTYANQTTTGLVTVNASSATVQAFVRDFLKTKVGNMSFGDLFPYGVWELNGSVMSINDILVTLRNGDVLHLKLHTMPEAMGGSGGTADGTVDFDNPDQIWGNDFTPTPDQNGYGAEGEITVGFKVMYQGETDEAVIVVKAQSITLEALIRDYLDGPLGGMTFSEILPYGSWYLNGQMMGVNGAATVLKNHDVITLSMRTLPSQDDGPGDSGGSDDTDDEYVMIEIETSDGVKTYRHRVSSNNGKEMLASILTNYFDHSAESLLENGIIIEVNGQKVFDATERIINGDRIYFSVVGTEFDSNDRPGSSGDNKTVSVILLYNDNTFDTYSRDVSQKISISEYLALYMELDFDKMLRHGKWRVNGVDVSDGEFLLRGGEHVMFRQNGLNNSDNWSTGVKGVADTNDGLVYPFNISVPATGIAADDFYKQYFEGVFKVSLEDALGKNNLLLLVDDSRIFDAEEAADVKIYPDSIVRIYWYSIPDGHKSVFEENMIDPVDASVCLSYLDGSADYIGFWALPGATVREAFELYGYCFDYYAQFGRFLDSDDREISGDSLIPADGYFRWQQEEEFVKPDFSLSTDPDDLDFSIKLGFKFENQLKEETVRFYKDGMTLDKFYQMYLSDAFFDGWDYNNLSKCGSWYFENKLCTKSTVITDGGYLEFRFSFIPEDSNFDELFDTTTPVQMIHVTVDASALYKELPPITVTVPAGTTFEAAIKYALEKYGYSYEDTLEADGAWQLPGLVLKDGDTLTYVKGGGTVTPPVIVPDEFLIQFTETYPNTEITGISLSVKRKMGETITLREFAEEYVLDRLNMTFEQSLEEGVWYIDGNRALSERLLFKSCTVEFRRNTTDVPGGDVPGGTEKEITVYLVNSSSSGTLERTPFKVRVGTTLAELVGMVSGMSYDEMIEMGRFAVNGAPVDNGHSYVLREGEEILFVPNGSSGGDAEQVILVYLTVIVDGQPETLDAELREGSTLYDLANLYTVWGYEGSLEYGYWTINGSDKVKPEMPLSHGDEVEFVYYYNGDVGGDECVHEWDSASGTCVKCYEPCPVDHAVDAIYAPCHVCGFAGFAGGGFEHRMIAIYLNGAIYTHVTVSYLPGEYPTLDDVLGLTDLGLFADLNEDYVILSDAREAEFGNGGYALYYDTEIYINSRPEDIPPEIWYNVYCTKFYASDNWQNATKNSWCEIGAGSTVAHAMKLLYTDIWENDRIYINGELVENWSDATITGDTYIVVLDGSILNHSIVGTVVNELTGKTRTVTYEAPVYFAMVRDALVGTLDEGLIYSVSVEGGHWGESAVELPIAYNFTVTISEKTTNIFIKVVDDNGNLSVMNQTVKGVLPTVGDFIKTYLGGSADDYYVASVEGGSIWELTAEDTIPEYWGYIIPKSQIKSEITITYDMTHRDYGQMTGSITVKAPVLLYDAFRDTENAGPIENILWDSWRYTIYVDGVELSEEDKGGSFLLLWKDCTVTAMPAYTVRIEYMEYIGDLPVVDPIQVSDPDLTLGEVLEMMGFDVSMFIIEMDLSMRIGDMAHSEEIVIHARPKMLRFELCVMDFSGYEMHHVLEGFIGSATLEEVMNLFSSMHGMPSEDYIWSVKDPMTGEVTVLDDPSYTWYYTDENGGYVSLLLESKLTRVYVNVMDSNWNSIFFMEYPCERGTTVAEFLVLCGAPVALEDIVSINTPEYGQIGLDFVIEGYVSLEIIVENGEGDGGDPEVPDTPTKSFVVYFNGVGYHLENPMSLYDFLRERVGGDADADGMWGTWYVDGKMIFDTYSFILSYDCTLTYEYKTEGMGFEVWYEGNMYWLEAPVTLYDFLVKYAMVTDPYATGTWYVDGMAIESIYYYELSYGCTVSREYKAEVIGFEVWFEGSSYWLERPMSLYDFVCKYLMLDVDSAVWYVDGMAIESIYDYELSYGCTVSREYKAEVIGFEVWFEGSSYWLERPMSLYDFICNYLYIDMESAMAAVWYVDGMMIESIYDYQLSYTCTVSCEIVEMPIMGFEVNCNGYIYWLEAPISLYEFAYKIAYAELGADIENGYWIVNGEVVDFYSYTLTGPCEIKCIYKVPVIDAVA